MGYTYNDLVAPAILLDNPGITREGFAKLLDQTHSSCFHEYKPEDKWDYYNKETEDDNYHRGLEGLAYILGLEDSQNFIEFQQPKADENGLLVKPPLMLPAREGADYQFEVIVHEKNVFEEPRIEQDQSFGKLKIGDIWEESMTGYDTGIILKILDEIKYQKGEEEEESGPGYEYKMLIKPFHAECREEHFKSKQELYEKWPQFHTDFANNWSQKTGHFIVGCLGGNNFLWIQKQGKYYFDKQTFDRIPASFGSSLSLGYVDLILTSEAIKHKAWKVLSRRGLQHCPQFLEDFPEAVPRYARAVWDSHTSLSAKMQGMSISNFLRFRMLKN
jgi:hypothetical protein